jgi:hypothetical protein
MAIGRSAPRYEALALLYPWSKTLQAHLSEYFIVVVRLCHNLMKFAQKSGLKQFTSSLGDSDLKTAESNLNEWAGAIKEEVNLLLAKKINDETQEVTGLRALIMKDSDSLARRQKLAARFKCWTLAQPMITKQLGSKPEN